MCDARGDWRGLFAGRTSFIAMARASLSLRKTRSDSSTLPHVLSAMRKRLAREQRERL